MKTLKFLFAVLWTCSEAAALSPPWYTLWNEIRSTVGRDPDIHVDPLDTSRTPYVINIRVPDSAKAQALASVLAPAYNFGNVAVAVHVAGATALGPSSASAWAETLRAAFETNPLFVSAYAPPDSPAMVTFAKSVVQFFNDDTGELYGNYNHSAADALRDVLTGSLGSVESIGGPLILGTAPFAVANGASFGPALAAPNTILSVMGPEAACGSGLHILVGGEPAAILYASPTWINFVIPADVTADGAILQMMCDASATSGSLILNVEQTAPALFTTAQNGAGQASAVNEDFSYNAAGTPARRGSVVTVYGTGFGQARPPDASGIAHLVLSVTATVGGVAADVQDAMLAPGMTAGVQQIKIKVPPDVPAGPSVPILLQVGGRSTQAATTIAVN